LSENRQTKLLDYLRLFRLPNVFTAIADTAMALSVAHFTASSVETQTPNIAAFLLLFAATSLMYSAGMALNDVFDFEQDLRERPQRPIPSGRIDRAHARRLGLGMLVAGGLAAPTAVWLGGGSVVSAVVFSAALLAAIFTYDAGGKRSFIGPYLMGSCRTLNILVVLSMAGPGALWTAPSAATLLLSGGIGVYIAGITWFGRTEAAKASNRGMLSLAVLHMIVGIAMVMSFPDFVTSSSDEGLAAAGPNWRLPSTSHFFLLIMILAIPVVRRAAIAVANPIPERVQATIKQGIFSLIVFDAGITLMVAPWYYAVLILLLLVPTLTLGKWVYST
jgi:4-hydroxybenzoate polyprenyltransferase